MDLSLNLVEHLPLEINNMIQSMEIFRFFRKKQIKVFKKLKKSVLTKSLIQFPPPPPKTRIFPENQIFVFRNHNNSGFSMVMYYRFRKYLGFSSTNQLMLSKYLKSTFLTKMCLFFSYNGRAIPINKNKVFNNIL